MSSLWVCTMDEETRAELQSGSATLLPLGTAWQGGSTDKEVRRYPQGVVMVWIWSLGVIFLSFFPPQPQYLDMHTSPAL